MHKIDSIKKGYTIVASFCKKKSCSNGSTLKSEYNLQYSILVKIVKLNKKNIKYV